MNIPFVELLLIVASFIRIIAWTYSVKIKKKGINTITITSIQVTSYNTKQFTFNLYDSPKRAL